MLLMGHSRRLSAETQLSRTGARHAHIEHPPHSTYVCDRHTTVQTAPTGRTVLASLHDTHSDGLGIMGSDGTEGDAAVS